MNLFFILTITMIGSDAVLSTVAVEDSLLLGEWLKANLISKLSSLKQLSTPTVFE